MPYETLASSQTPALIIYALDVSGSMSTFMAGKRRIDIVMEALSATLQQMVFRCTKGQQISQRYLIAMFAYSDQVYDILGGVRYIDEVASLGVPELNTMRSTATDQVFLAVEDLLQNYLPSLQYCPAPLVCHMTDGEYTGQDPEPIAQRIMAMGNYDGNVLIENIFISDNILSDPIYDPSEWPGIQDYTNLRTKYASKLQRMSSRIPESYRVMMAESGYAIQPGAFMMLPGNSPDLIQMGFVMSMSTPVVQ